MGDLCKLLHHRVSVVEPANLRIARELLCAHGAWLDKPLWDVFEGFVDFSDPTEPLIAWRRIAAQMAHPAGVFTTTNVSVSAVAVLRICAILATDQLPVSALCRGDRELVAHHMMELLAG